MSDRSDPMGPDDILVIASQDFTVRGNKDLYQASYALMSYFSGLCRHGRIADAYAGPTQPPAEHGYDPRRPRRRAPHRPDRSHRRHRRPRHHHRPRDHAPRLHTTLARTLPDQYSPDEIQVLTIAIGGDDLTITHLDRTAAYRRVGLTP
ncbi:hypothetical protein [Pseudonocardia sp. ICBG601]|uniref:hypothetical protein n=1 Tax=Pseudonocardia sp. ICBG601 TaxID=2846759 RepID=UPI001CF6BDBF|nr:hypothetical protein [Pseudonocardia sp. ICBG601]